MLHIGKGSTLNELISVLYHELHRIASWRLRGERSNHTLSATALVHETYLKLCDLRDCRFNDEVHFLAVASRVMRQVLVDYARRRATQKRSGGTEDHRSGAPAAECKSDESDLLQLIELDDAITALAATDGSLARLIEMRYFGGMSAEESAEALDMSVHVVRHDLRFAHAWLWRRLTRD